MNHFEAFFEIYDIDTFSTVPNEKLAVFRYGIILRTLASNFPDFSLHVHQKKVIVRRKINGIPNL